MELFANEKNNTFRVIKEGIAVGLTTILAGYFASRLIKPYFGVTLPDICKGWNQKHVMEWSLFLTGFLVHVVLEITGANKTYATYRSKIN